MNRRDFLLKSASFLAGTLFGLAGLESAFGAGTSKSKLLHTPRMALIIDDISYNASRAKRKKVPGKKYHFK